MFAVKARPFWQAEKYRLQDKYSNNQIQNPMDIIYFSAFNFNTNFYDLAEMVELAQNNKDLSRIFRRYVALLKEEPGCEMMCQVIDSFIGKEFNHGLTIEDQNYEESFYTFSQRADKDMEGFFQTAQLPNNSFFVRLSAPVKEALGNFMEKDRANPYDDFERILLNRLVQPSPTNIESPDPHDSH